MEFYIFPKNLLHVILCIGGSVVEFSPATREARVQFPANATFFNYNFSTYFIPNCLYQQAIKLTARLHLKFPYMRILLVLTFFFTILFRLIFYYIEIE